jgi:nucleotide-binding universal stress UspA family protein
MTFKKLLCPTDFSPGAQHATRVAARIAAELGAELVVAHVWQPPRFAYGGADPLPAEVFQRIARERQDCLAAAASQLTGFGARSVTTRVLAGVPWEQIIDILADDEAFDLVVMGTHGRTGISRVLLGSVTEKVVRHAPCSVVATRPRSNATSFGHVLCPVDFSDSSRRAVERAAELAAPAGSGIALLHVVELPVSYSAPPFTAELIDNLERRSASVLEDWAAGLRSRVSVPVTTEIRFGSPAAQVLAVLDRDPSFDLVVVGCHGRTGLRRALIGSVAEQVTRHAQRCTLTTR